MKNLYKTLSLTAVVVLWYIASHAMNNPLFLPTPEATIAVILEMFTSGLLWQHLAWSFGRVTLAIAITATISIPLGICIASYSFFDNLFSPIFGFLRYVPVTGFVPLLILLLGIDENMKIIFLVIATLLSFLPTVVQTCHEMDRQLLESAYTMGFDKNRAIWHVLIPYVLPSILKALVTLYGVGWTFVIVAEITNAQFGLGHLMYIGSARGMTDVVFAALLVIFAVSFIFDKSLNFALERLFSWKWRGDHE